MPVFLSPLRHPFLCSLLTGVLLVAIFPSLHLSWLAWVALAPLFAVCVHRWSRLRLFLYGYLAGVVFFAGSCYWIYDVMHVFGRLSVAAAGGILLLFVLAFAVFLGLFALLVGELARRWQLLALFLFPFAWVALEWLRTFLIFGGFPWNLLGYAVAPHVGWIQPAAYAGIYGVSFLVAATNAVVASYWLAPARRQLWLLAVVAAVLGVTYGWGLRLPPVAAPEQAVLVQPNLPQLQEFDPAWLRNHPDELLALEQLSQEAVQQQAALQPSLLVWPEVPVPFYFHRDPVLRARLLQLAQGTRSYLLAGIVDYRSEGDGPPHPYNSAVLLSPTGGFVGQYDKIHLVPFGEYLPIRNLLGLTGSLVAEVSDFRPGRGPVVLPTGQDRLAVFICYEAIFPGLVREFVQGGATVLVNISNDGWFGRSSAAAQHLNMARVRAVETRRFLLRATNTGVTAVVDPLGRVVARAPEQERTVLRARFGHRSQQSFYVRYGDWFAALCTFVVVAALARKFWITAVEGGSDADDGRTGTAV